MIGLEIELEKRKDERNSMFNISGIASILNCPYNTVKSKLKSKHFTIDEAFTIYEKLNFVAKDNYEALKYLFTEVQ